MPTQNGYCPATSLAACTLIGASRQRFETDVLRPKLAKTDLMVIYIAQYANGRRQSQNQPYLTTRTRRDQKKTIQKSWTLVAEYKKEIYFRRPQLDVELSEHMVRA
ncbi:hypothetical protein BIW11_00468 [Tropilaelaps mercedesae]|uniref:Uncharacterized protein n=1 Tax=Tropilaelaps mercedesae TaxID=418985 RepID=A0A1V9XUS8_9ACAR|nr:hypothetical protein BIW11_00468 [Tropilaelaps mercedesae]